MNIHLISAGILCIFLGVAHSFLGEYLIFKDKRDKGSLVPSKESTTLKERHLRIIWATWHLASLFGWCIGAILIKMSFEPSELNSSLNGFIIQSIICTMLFSSLLVLAGTKGRHPGWVVLLLIGGLLIIAG